MIQKIAQHHRYKIILISLSVICISLLWTNGGRWFASKSSEDISPKGYYRIEFWRHPIVSEEGYAYLYNNETDELLAKSQKYYIDGNSDINWKYEHKGRKGIRIGVDVRFLITPEPDQLCCLPNQVTAPLKAKLLILE